MTYIDLVPDHLRTLHYFWGKEGEMLPCVSREADVAGFNGKSVWVGVDSANASLIARFLATNPSLEELAVDGRYIPESVIAAIPGLKDLRRLDLAPIRSPLPDLNSLTSLRTLGLESVCSDDDLSAFSRLSTLEALTVGQRGPELTWIGEAQLHNLECLTLMSAVKSKHLRLDSLEPLMKCPNLRILAFFACRPPPGSLRLLADTKVELVVSGSKSWLSKEDRKFLETSKIRLVDPRGT